MNVGEGLITACDNVRVPSHESLGASDRVRDHILDPTILPERFRFVGKRLHRTFDSVPVPITNRCNDATILLLGDLPAHVVIARDRELLGVGCVA